MFSDDLNEVLDAYGGEIPEEEICLRDDCRQDRDYCCDCFDGSLYISPDSYNEDR